ncbi:transcriptional regulator, AraC family [Bacillus sp. OV322]|uniref:AraC family transcriptional regulator n=1 Tax=Bacillus sp. OV322 TaxID=1882764 RepID=UPI0008DED41C|nr:AraC family transcriptional regulator [Bacillus sp. OV322]SFC91709.1 transcriptional regulator, AraC family [Bacillus sp. OV322]
MGWVESLQKAIDYMEDHLLEDMDMKQIAKEANSSVFHFQRTFALLTDVSVGEYLRRRRLTLAAQELVRSQCKIIDLAYKYGYDTPEAFSRAFRRQHGVKPSEVRKNHGKLNAYNRLIIQVTLKGRDPMKYKIVERESFQVVGVKREFSLAGGENLKGIPLFWNDVHSDGTNDVLLSLDNGRMYGICVDKSSENQQMDYWIAAEYGGEVPEGLSAFTMPSSKWSVFEVHGAMPDAIQKAWKQIMSEWFPSGHYQHGGTPEMEVYSDGDPSSPDYYSEIWIPVK